MGWGSEFGLLVKMAQKRLRKSAFKRNYTGITHTFAYFEKMAQELLRNMLFFFWGIDSEIAQNFDIFEKISQEKLRILHENFGRGNSAFNANLIYQNYCNLPLSNAPAPRTRWPVSRPPPSPPPPPPVKVWRQGRPLPPARGRHAPPLPVPSPKLWYSGLLQQDRLRPKKSMHVQVLPSVELWWVTI